MQEPLLGSAAGSSRSSSPRRGPHLPIPRPASTTVPSQPPSRPRSPQRLTAATARSSAAAAADIRVEDLGFGAAHEWWHRLNMLVKLLAIAVLMAYFSPAVGSSLPAPYSKISALTGYAYFVMWSASFWPQVLTNYRRKSVRGVSLDYLVMNVLGFACYAIFNISLVFSAHVKQQYQQRFGRVGVPVELNDLFFAVHAVLLSTVTAMQCLCYDRGTQRVHSGTWAGLVVALAGGGALAGRIILHGEGDTPFTWLDVCYYCSFVKMGVTLVKCIPQVIMNFSRQSTVGWSLDNVLLDIGGGFLSMFQLFMSCTVLNDWSLVTGNPIKLGLGLSSVCFDVIFILQHFVFESPAATTQQYVDSAFWGELGRAPQGCGNFGCACPCPRCRFTGPINASDLAAIGLIGTPATVGTLLLSAPEFQEYTRCICTHGAAGGFTPLASQFYRGVNVGSLSNLYRSLPEGHDFII